MATTTVLSFDNLYDDYYVGVSGYRWDDYPDNPLILGGDGDWGTQVYRVLLRDLPLLFASRDLGGVYRSECGIAAGFGQMGITCPDSRFHYGFSVEWLNDETVKVFDCVTGESFHFQTDDRILGCIRLDGGRCWIRDKGGSLYCLWERKEGGIMTFSIPFSWGDTLHDIQKRDDGLLLIIGRWSEKGLQHLHLHYDGRCVLSHRQMPLEESTQTEQIIELKDEKSGRSLNYCLLGTFQHLYIYAGGLCLNDVVMISDTPVEKLSVQGLLDIHGDYNHFSCGFNEIDTIS